MSSKFVRMQEFARKMNVEESNDPPAPPPSPPPPPLPPYSSGSTSSPLNSPAVYNESTHDQFERIWHTLDQTTQTLTQQIEKIGHTLDQITQSLKFSSEMLSRRIDAETNLIYKRFDDMKQQPPRSSIEVNRRRSATPAPPKNRKL